MRFESIETLINSVLATYRCPECESQTNKNNIEILWIAWTSVNLDIICPKCHTHSLFASQMLQMNINLDKFKNTLNKNLKKISDQEIVSLNKDLKKDKINVEDLFE